MESQKSRYAWTATVGAKGQIVIPKEARAVYGYGPGDTLLLLGDVERGIAIPPKGTFGELFKLVYSKGGEA